MVRRADGREISLDEFPLEEVFSAGEMVRAEELVLQVPDGRSVTVLVNATPVRSEDGELESFVVTLQDMTPLEEMERLRADFLAMVSHELQAPLASIRGSATTLLHDESDLGRCRDASVLPDHRAGGQPDAQPDQRPAGRGAHRDRHTVGRSRTCRRDPPGGRG